MNNSLIVNKSIQKNPRLGSRGVHLLFLSKPLFTNSKVLLFSRLIYYQADNYQRKCYDNPKRPSSKLQFHLLPASEFLFDRIWHLYLFGDCNFLRRKIYRIRLCLHLSQQVSEAVNSKLGLCILAVCDVQPRQNDSSVFITLQQCSYSGAVRW